MKRNVEALFRGNHIGNGIGGTWNRYLVKKVRSGGKNNEITSSGSASHGIQVVFAKIATPSSAKVRAAAVWHDASV
ncbi:hypothetical protein [Paenibacillus phytorum]|uniref:hypothetical protein n=1 Tax=Paenibacillus phytorum TaxID=2654977 RepID=UPI0014929F19|nr:hypothetical protein [Paenibacillus phytorum]